MIADCAKLCLAYYCNLKFHFKYSIEQKSGGVNTSKYDKLQDIYITNYFAVRKYAYNRSV